MKMIIAIIDDVKSDVISRALLNSNYRVTQLATTSGFLRGGATTLMVGVDDELVGDALQIIRDQIPASTAPDKYLATIYVLNIKNFNRL